MIADFPVTTWAQHIVFTPYCLSNKNVPTYAHVLPHPTTQKQNNLLRMDLLTFFQKLLAYASQSKTIRTFGPIFMELSNKKIYYSGKSHIKLNLSLSNAIITVALIQNLA